jgi:hypothetical protein
LGTITEYLPIASGDTLLAESTSDTTTTHVLHATATGGIGTFSAIASGDLPAQYRTGTCLDGVASNAALPTSGYAAQLSCMNKTGATWTITGITCYSSSSDSSTINLTDTSTTNLLSTATCSCSTTAGGAACTQSATTTIASGVGILGNPATPGGTSKNITWTVTYTY